MTDRITVNKTQPLVQFILEADRQSQSIELNGTYIRMYMRSVNIGNTTSYYAGAGTQTISIDGISGSSRSYSATPFLPSGVANGVTRWRGGPYDIFVPHGADGTRGAVTLRLSVTYGNINDQHTVSFNDFPSIPRGPRAKVDGVWRNTVMYIKDAGVWKIVIPYIKNSGIWKIGGG